MSIRAQLQAVETVEYLQALAGMARLALDETDEQERKAALVRTVAALAEARVRILALRERVA